MLLETNQTTAKKIGKTYFLKQIKNKEKVECLYFETDRHHVFQTDNIGWADIIEHIFSL